MLLAAPLSDALALDFAMQAAFGALAIVLKSERFFDLIGSLTFALAVLQLSSHLAAPSLPQKLQAGAVLLWAFRLGSFLFYRITLASGVDRRFNKARDRPAVFAAYWLLQGVWVAMTLLPTALLLSRPDGRTEVEGAGAIGLALFAVGWLFEAVADVQKHRFRGDPANARKFIKTGLWSISRHPNYFGEILLWAGLFVAATPVLETGAEWAAAAASPAFVALLLIKVSGIPILERQAKKRWGDTAEWKAYSGRTALLVPFVW